MSKPKSKTPKRVFLTLVLVMLFGVAIVRMTDNGMTANTQPKTEISSPSSVYSSPWETESSSVYDTSESGEEQNYSENFKNSLASQEAKTESSAPAAPKKNKTKQAGTQKVVTFGLPVKSDIIKMFSVDELIYSRTYEDMRAHTGIDIAAKDGEPVKSCAKGEVIKITKDALWGSVVEISHEGGIISRYCGLRDINVKKGDSVTSTTVLGLVGEIPCECMDNSHLHFEMLRNGSYIPPLATMGLDSEAKEKAKTKAKE